MEEMNIQRIGAIAMEAMLFEVSATPKPGLVDRANCGAHKDMDFFTFMSSGAALRLCFDQMAGAGLEARNDPIEMLLPRLRELGIRAEEQMFARTDGVNTHKGMIFTLGILCGCAGWQMEKGGLSHEILCKLAARMCQGLCAKEYAGLEQKETLTKGERMYLRYGCRGVRGEVESGYGTVRKISLPVYRKLRGQQVPLNDALVQTLLHLIAHTVDTNIIARHDWGTAEYARQSAAEAIKAGGMQTEEGRRLVGAMDRDFIKRYISPGGCADLLAVTHFLYTLEEEGGRT